MKANLKIFEIILKSCSPRNLLEFGNYLVGFSNVAPIEVAKALYTKLDSEEA